jgi:hypothetical protein
MRIEPFRKAAFFTLLAIVWSLNVNGQGDKGNYRIDLKMLEKVYSLKKNDGRPYLKFAVTVTNLSKVPVDFGLYIVYSYKKYREQDYYMEATDLKGEPVVIDGNADIDWFYDPTQGKRNTNRIVDTISTGIYVFKKGKYKVRWVYDPANNTMHADAKVKPVYSNWEAIEVVE